MVGDDRRGWEGASVSRLPVPPGWQAEQSRPLPATNGLFVPAAPLCGASRKSLGKAGWFCNISWVIVVFQPCWLPSLSSKQNRPPTSLRVSKVKRSVPPFSACRGLNRCSCTPTAMRCRSLMPLRAHMRRKYLICLSVGGRGSLKFLSRTPTGVGCTSSP